MCGIAGIFNMNGAPVSPGELRKMTDVIAHRGPDSEGFYIDSFIGLGHRRLAIIDISRAGHQPMRAGNDNYILTYNGEIYNFKELKNDLESKGHIFYSKTDSEVVLRSYIEWGHECVQKFNGMFAFAIWDKTRHRLFLARDRYGVKPLYYAFHGNSFVFASEQKSILTDPRASKEINCESLLEYFTFQNLFTQNTLLKGISIFPTGCWATISLGQNISSLSPICYWDYNFREPERALRDGEYVEELDRLFNNAVRRQLVSDVPLGAYLSGGMDSGAITSTAAKHLPWMTSFTCGFDLHSASGLELAFDEREKAEYMSYLFKTEHYEMVLKAGDMERVMPKLIYHIEEPRVGQSYPNYYIAQLASKFVKVVLAGTGGDELFGGYPWRYYRAVVNDNFEDYIDKYYNFWQRLIPNKIIHKVFEPIWGDVKHVWTRDIFKNVFSKQSYDLNKPEDYINCSLYFEAKTFLHGLLVVEDKLNMAHGLESRVPFLDNDLVDFAMQVPVSLKLGNLGAAARINENEPGNKKNKYYQRSKDGKLILRKVMSRYIPDSIYDCAKQGFSAPDATWFKGDSIKFIRERLLREDNNIYKYLNRREIVKLVEEHLNGKNNRRLLIWSLLSFDEVLKSID